MRRPRPLAPTAYCAFASAKRSSQQGRFQSRQPGKRLVCCSFSRPAAGCFRTQTSRTLLDSGVACPVEFASARRRPAKVKISSAHKASERATRGILFEYKVSSVAYVYVYAFFFYLKMREGLAEPISRDAGSNSAGLLLLCMCSFADHMLASSPFDQK